MRAAITLWAVQGLLLMPNLDELKHDCRARWKSSCIGTLESMDIREQVLPALLSKKSAALMKQTRRRALSQSSAQMLIQQHRQRSCLEDLRGTCLDGSREGSDGRREGAMTVEMLFKRMWAPAPLACIPRHFGPCPSVPCSSRSAASFFHARLPLNFPPAPTFCSLSADPPSFPSTCHISPHAPLLPSLPRSDASALAPIFNTGPASSLKFLPLTRSALRPPRSIASSSETARHDD
jgi:hypothetical protein